MIEFMSRTWKSVLDNNQTIVDHPDLDIVDQAQIELHTAYLQKATYLLDDICKEITGKSIINISTEITDNEDVHKHIRKKLKLD